MAHVTPITKENLRLGTGNIQHLTKHALNGGDDEEPKGKTFHFGKYKGRSIEDVRDENPGYIDWVRENVKGYENI